MATEKTTASKILELHAEGLTTGEIAKELGIRYQWVYNVLSQKGLMTHTRERGDTKSAEMIRRFNTGETTGQIAKEMGVRYQFVYNVLSQAKLIVKKG